MAKMKRLEKLEGFGNVQMVEADLPNPGPDEVLVKVKRSLISRGSELFRRYVAEEALPPRIMGYCDVGDVVGLGSDVQELRSGQRVFVSAPHAQYVVGPSHGEDGKVFEVPDELSYEAAIFVGLAAGAVAWMRIPPIEPGDTVVVNGQGLVGNLCSQAVRERRPGRVITVDAIDLRCRISRECGADEVINVSETDSVQAVLDLTDGQGADVVVEAVGGFAGAKSFEQALQMVKTDGVLHLIALYQGQALSLDSGLAMNKMIIGGYYRTISPPERLQAAMHMVQDGRIKFEPLITHRLPWQETAEAYHLLYNSPDEALGVVLEWD
jgi:2-desacetyl-2-hydroxyethyl bacteriochlorophyllide A dehydrogenase